MSLMKVGCDNEGKYIQPRYLRERKVVEAWQLGHSIKDVAINFTYHEDVVIAIIVAHGFNPTLPPDDSRNSETYFTP